MPRVACAERRHDEKTTNVGIDIGIRRSCPVDVEFVDPRFVDFCDVFIPGFLPDPSSFAERISLPLPDGSWRPLYHLAKEYKLGPIDPWQLVHLHVRAGRKHEPQTIPGLPFEFDAIGIKLHPSTCVSFVNLDLDDGESKPTPAAYIAFLRRIGACPLIIRGSGNPRRFRALLRLANPMPIEQMQLLMRGIFRVQGMKPPEIYPSTTIASRVPGGNRSCVRFYPDDLDSPRPLPFDELVHAWHDLPAFDLDDAFVRFAHDAHEFEQDADKTNPSDELTKPSKRKGKKLVLTAKERADVERYRREGIQPDERLTAYRLLIKDDVCRGLTREECCESMKEWIRDGKIARSNHFRKRYKSRYIAAALADIPRHVERLYAAYEKCTSPAVHLSVRDILNLAPIVERVAAQLGITQARVGAEVLLLSRWKGLPDAIRTERGILTHCSIFKRAAGNKSDYAVIRDALGLWRPTSGYIAQRWAMNGQGKARRYACDFEFDESSPGRALGRDWPKALAVAKARQDKPSRTSAKTKTSTRHKTQQKQAIA